jgi:uncharacterized membrane protein SpoIIM required for sporulation
MKVAELLEQRRANWRELEQLCDQLEQRTVRSLGADKVHRFAALYRSACADLALADAYSLPANTVAFLHQLVGRAHNQLYRSTSFRLHSWLHELLVGVPRRLFHDNSVRIVFCAFWGVFLASMLYAYNSPQFTQQVVGEAMIESMEAMYSQPIDRGDPNASGFMSGFYVWNNAGIGLQCFAAGMLLGVGGLFIVVSNAAVLGAVFGHMATIEQRVNFFNFVTAHGPFELTAIILSGAAGMRLGFALIDTRGWSRMASVRLAAREAVPSVAAAVILFILAAIIEAFISPFAIPYPVKAAVAVATSGMLVFYFVVLGYGPPPPATEQV